MILRHHEMIRPLHIKILPLKKSQYHTIITVYNDGKAKSFRINQAILSSLSHILID